ncbi:MAG: hypothetical protein ACE5EY_01210 [Anaerolineae bacterium]
MRDGSNAAAFFDLDGTLYNDYVWRALRRYHQIHHFKLPSLYAYLGTHVALWPLKNASLISDELIHWMWGTHMAWLVREVADDRPYQAGARMVIQPPNFVIVFPPYLRLDATPVASHPGSAGTRAGRHG